MGVDISRMINNEQYVELYTLARYYYREFNPIMKDELYEELQNIVKIIEPDLPLLKQTYDDDEVPTTLINLFANGEILKNLGTGNRYRHLLEDEHSLSILPVDNWIGVYNFVHELPENTDLTMSIKVDGVNQKSAYVKNEDTGEYEFKCSLSRGRKEATPKDYTEHLAKIVPLKFKRDSDKDFFDVRGEVYTDSIGKKLLKEEYSDIGVKFASAKSTAGSMLTRGYPALYYKYLHMLAFYCPGLSNTASGTFGELQKLGFTVPPNLKLNTSEAPKDFKEFKSWLIKYMDRIYKKGKELGIPSDGAVLEVDDLNFIPTINGQYSSRNIALKLEQWSYKYYKGIVTGLIDEQREVFGSVRVTIEPLDTEDGVEAKIIYVYNPDILIKSKAFVGNEVYFERKSDTYSTLIYGERLEKLLKTGVL